MNIVVLTGFCSILVFCIIMNIPTTYALFAGVVIFSLYARSLKFSWREIWKMMCSRLYLVKHLFIIISLIGIMTAMWRACGTIQTIVCYAVRLLTPETFLMMSFLINCGVSFLAGSSFGTAATFGVICMSIGHSLGIDPVALGGAAIAGAFFGDRNAPVSSDAVMVSIVTETDIHSNVKRMLKEAFVPMVISCGLYLAIGFSSHTSGSIDSANIFADYYNIDPIMLIPAAIILGFAVMKISVIYAVIASTAAGFILAIFFQNGDAASLLKMCMTGYESGIEEIAGMIDGGGFSSMLTCLVMSMFSCSYAGLFEETGLLDPLKRLLRKMGDKVSPYFALLVGGTGIIAISCSQMLPLMLLNDEMMELENGDAQQTAMDFENSIIPIAPLIPWTIASSVPLASIGASPKSLMFAFYLYILPAVTLIRSVAGKKRT